MCSVIDGVFGTGHGPQPDGRSAELIIDVINPE